MFQNSVLYSRNLSGLPRLFRGRKCALHFPDAPPVTTYHSYDINYKYIYECTTCQRTVKLHSKKRDIASCVCPIPCMGSFVQIKPAPKQKSAFQVFSDNSRKQIKLENPGLTFGQVSKKVSEAWRTHKAACGGQQNEGSTTGERGTIIGLHSDEEELSVSGMDTDDDDLRIAEDGDVDEDQGQFSEDDSDRDDEEEPEDEDILID
jgi:HMG (high mobility group) box